MWIPSRNMGVASVVRQPSSFTMNVTFKQSTVLKTVVASGTFLPSLFRERARVPSKANASKPGTPKTSIAHEKFSSGPVLNVTSPGIRHSRRQLPGL
jgi:hypothetical protein